MLQQTLPKTGIGVSRAKARCIVEVSPEHDTIGHGGARVTYQRELVKCGKANCKRCSKRGAAGHGPYWYAYWTTFNRTRSLYIGKIRKPAREVLAARQERKLREVET